VIIFYTGFLVQRFENEYALVKPKTLPNPFSTDNMLNLLNTGKATIQWPSIGVIDSSVLARLSVFYIIVESVR
jgi:hypothetical protein